MTLELQHILWKIWLCIHVYCTFIDHPHFDPWNRWSHRCSYIWHNTMRHEIPNQAFSTSCFMQIWWTLFCAIACMQLSKAAKVNSFGWCSAANSGLKAVTEQYLTPFPSLNTCSMTKWWNCDVLGKLSMLKFCADTLEIIGISILKSQPYSSFGRTLPNTARAVHLRAERSQVPSRLHILHTRVCLQ